YTFNAADHGVHTFTVILKTAGSQSLTVTDTANTALTTGSSVAVTAAAASNFRLNGLPASTTAGDQQFFTLTALDPYGNVASGYRGLVHFTSTDSQATLPNDALFQSFNQGVLQLVLTLKTAGSQ